MLDFLGYDDASAAVVRAIETVLADGPRTRDMKGTASTAEVGDAIASLIVACLLYTSPRLNTRDRPIVNQYREGKAKRTPGGE